RAAVDAEGNYTGDLEFYAYGGHKAQAVRQLAARQHINLPMSYAYSDSITDLPMLELVGHPVVVNGDKELERVARERDLDDRYFDVAYIVGGCVVFPRLGPARAGAGAFVAGGAGGGVGWWPPPRTFAAGGRGTGGGAARRARAAAHAARADGPVHRLARRP